MDLDNIEARLAARTLGKRGGAIGGLSKSKAKLKASLRNLAAARRKRWPKK